MAVMTIAEILAARARKAWGAPLETREYAAQNPLGVRLGGVLLVDHLDFRGVPFVVREIRGVTECVGGQAFGYADYVVVGTPHEATDLADEAGKIRRRLRIVPVEEPDRLLQWDAVWLECFYEAPFAQAVEDGLYSPDYEVGQEPIPALQDPGGLFRDGDTEYRRRFGDTQPHVCEVVVLKDRDGNGTLEADEVSAPGRIQYWDYERTEPNGVETLMYVEEDVDGFFRAFRGQRLPQESIVRV